MPLTAGLWVAGALLLLVLSLLLAGTLPVIMYPKDDGRNRGITMELPSDTTRDQSQICADALGEVLQGKAYLQSVVKFTGSKSPMALNSPAETLTPTRDRYLVGFSAYFTPLSERDHPAYQYLDELRPELEARCAGCLGGQLLLTPQLGGANNEDPVQILVTGPHIDVGNTPLVVGHDTGERTVTVKAKTEGTTTGQILQQLQHDLERMTAAWPEGYAYRFGGEAEESSETFSDMLTMLGVASLLVFALLVIQLDSFRQPLIILASVPLALIGVFSAFSSSAYRSRFRR
jgi:multidrug efflux pump subunit AcrB